MDIENSLIYSSRKIDPVSENRNWLEKEYLPNVKGSLLFVGIKEYCANYKKIAVGVDQFTTLDVNPEVAKFGGDYHYVSTLDEFILSNTNRKYQNISLHGLWGMNDSYSSDKAGMKESISNSLSALRSGGTLQFGAAIWDGIISEKEYEELFEDLGLVGNKIIHKSIVDVHNYPWKTHYILWARK